MRITPLPVTQWKEPALAWNGSVAEDGRASILEIRSDDFLPEFLAAMGGADPAAYYFDHRLEPKGSATLKLYQPLHGRFYLVTASLVCRQVGLPDKAIDRAGGESVFFVIRRRTAAGEEAWIALDKGGYWLPLAQDAVLAVAPGEDRLPLHPVQIQPRPVIPRSVFTDNQPRDLLYGYIPAGNRSKYRDTLRRTLPGASGGAPAALDPQTVVNNFMKDAEAHAPPGQTLSWRKEVFIRRVIRPWASLFTNFAAGNPPRLKVELSTNAQTEQLYALLELADFFKTYLPTLWAALVAGKGDSLAANSKLLNLYQRLTDSNADDPFKIRNNGSDQMLGAALLAFRDHIELVRGQGAIPATNLDLRPALSSKLAALKSAVDAAIDEETQPIPVPGGADNELVRLITEQVQPREAEGQEATYHIRVAYVYDADCPPLVSPAASHPFHLAAYIDPDAPARLIKIEAPSIKPGDLRKYARGVGLEMSPELHKLSSCMSGEKLDGIITSIGDCDDGGLSIRMICTFSIQIIFLVAFIVMFTFLIVLNFVFGWLAYLRICLPVPVKE